MEFDDKRIHEFLVHGLTRVHTSVYALNNLVKNKTSMKKVANLRAPIRRITPSLAMTIEYDAHEEKPFRLVVSRRGLKSSNGSVEWNEVDQEPWESSLHRHCNTPRALLRVLARIESFNEWLTRRQETLMVRYEALMKSQEPWMHKLRVREMMFELSDSNSLPQEVIGMLHKRSDGSWDKVEAIKLLRELQPITIPEALRKVNTWIADNA